ncbi:hypothetical protein D3C87_1531650 [compost metagenome]
MLDYTPANFTQNSIEYYQKVNADFKTRPEIKGFSSFLILGCGQMLNQDYTKSIIHITIGTILLIPFILSSQTQGATPHQPHGNIDSNQITGNSQKITVFTGIINIGFHLYSGLEAYQQSEKQRIQSSK